MSEWFRNNFYPKDGSKFELKYDDNSFPIIAYYGGGEDKAVRSWDTCLQIQNVIEWRPVRLTLKER